MKAEQRHEEVIAWARGCIESVDGDATVEDSAAERRVSVGLKRDMETVIHRCERRLAVLRGDE